jgi:hypothetical protein
MLWFLKGNLWLEIIYVSLLLLLLRIHNCFLIVNLSLKHHWLILNQLILNTLIYFNSLGLKHMKTLKIKLKTILLFQKLKKINWDNLLYWLSVKRILKCQWKVYSKNLVLIFWDVSNYWLKWLIEEHSK